jgi:hypothetical protein
VLIDPLQTILQLKLLANCLAAPIWQLLLGSGLCEGLAIKLVPELAKR